MIALLPFVLQDELAPVVEQAGPIELSVGFVFLALIGIGLLWPARQAENRLLGAAEPGPAVFQWADLVIAVGVFVVANMFAFFAIAYSSGAIDGASKEDGAETAIELTFMQEIAVTLTGFLVLSLYVLIAALTRRGGATAFGLRPGARVRTRLPMGRLAAGFVRYVATVPLLYASAAAFQLVMVLLGKEVPVQEVGLQIAEHLDAHFWPIVLFAVVLQPLFEEVVFRGFLLELLASKLGRRFALIATSILFGVLHGTAAAIPITVLALGLGWVKLRTGSIAVPFLLHALHNGVQVALAIHARH